MHVFSPDGEWLSFTYNDHVLHERDPALDLRNVAVAVPLHPVCTGKHHPREYDGEFFCCVVSRTTPAPQPGGDEISRAYEEGWIGEQGYLRADGSRQRRAIAFIGDTRQKTVRLSRRFSVLICRNGLKIMPLPAICRLRELAVRCPLRRRGLLRRG